MPEPRLSLSRKTVYRSYKAINIGAGRVVFCSVSDPYSLNPGSGSGQKYLSESGSRRTLNPDPDPKPSYFLTLSEKKIKSIS